MSEDPISIILVDDHTMFRQGLRTMLEQLPAFRVLADAGNGPAALELVREHQPNFLIVDYVMPELSGVEVVRQLSAELPSVHSLALSMHSEMSHVVAMLQAGASGFVLKEAAFSELERAVEVVLSGNLYLSPPLASDVILDYIKGGRRDPQSEGSLSIREQEVLRLLAEGGTTKSIAHSLKICVKTVESHRKRIKDKLDLQSTADLTKYALQVGLISL